MSKDFWDKKLDQNNETKSAKDLEKIAKDSGQTQDQRTSARRVLNERDEK